MLAVSSIVQNLLRTRCLASFNVFEHRHLSKHVKTVGQSKRKTIVFELPGSQYSPHRHSRKGQSKPVKTVGHSKRKTIVYEQPSIVPPPTAKELFKPMAVEPRREDADNLGEEIVGALSKGSIAKILVNFAKDKSVETLAQTNKVTGDLYQQCLESFTKYCLVSKPLSVTLHIVFKDIEAGAGHVTDLFPFFLDHAKQVFPHIECMDELRQISNLSDPTTWYPLARSMKRKIVFHAGPTNSGKTYHAMKSFLEAESGVYCGPLRLLAMEVYDKSNAQGVPCDLKTGETRKFANDDDSPSNHMACTVEMLNTNLEYGVAVIDEIQMIGDLQRGWSWTQALLGLAARELHVCGEETAIDLVEHLAYMCGDSFEVKRYSRLTKLEYLDKELGSLDNVRAGDCIVCFSKRDIFNIMTQLRERNINVSVIYGNQPPGTKINQSRQFNDPNSNCNVLVATDAIGMGLNLAIKRIIFYNINKTTLRHDGVKIRAPLSTSQALQISGRAGRFKTRFEDGEVTTYTKRDLVQLKRIVSLPRENIEDIFKHVCTVTDHFFMCNVTDIKTLAELLEDVPLNLRSKFTFCVAPLKVREGLPRIMFKRMAKRISEGHSLTYDWLCRALGAPFHMPRNQTELTELEAAFNVIDIYLWLSFRFEMFDDIAQVQDLRVELDTIIQAYMKSLNTGQQGQQPELSYEVSQQNPLQAYKFNPKKTGGKQKESKEMSDTQTLSSKVQIQSIKPEAYMKSLNTGQQGQQPELSYEVSQQNPLQVYKFNTKKTGGKQKESKETNNQTNGLIQSVPNFDSSYTREYLFSDPSSMKKQSDPQKLSSKVQIQSIKPEASHPKRLSAFDNQWKQNAGNQKDIGDDGIIDIASSSRQAIIEPLRLTTYKNSMKTPASSQPRSEEEPSLKTAPKEKPRKKVTPREDGARTPDVALAPERVLTPIKKKAKSPETSTVQIEDETATPAKSKKKKAKGCATEDEGVLSPKQEPVKSPKGKKGTKKEMEGETEDESALSPSEEPMSPKGKKKKGTEGKNEEAGPSGKGTQVVKKGAKVKKGQALTCGEGLSPSEEALGGEKKTKKMKKKAVKDEETDEKDEEETEAPKPKERKKKAKKALLHQNSFRKKTIKKIIKK
ncbi:ATP-dependent RNA helicase SUPV3L1, mitochondrial-like isoform X3 [Dreissena polymorpha]|uniref:ATP-dependent RNA helicase SUPV3L1, mitochondrial-like isoform X3 n=1 Tax=Dreissena polymorpha TaxID=45954 RepID=UPI002264B290|nr:ATP-dependent RNA helicase SUPV3L1, mitochondrial-like isoform X3 [Dreissena polymorpha]